MQAEAILLRIDGHRPQFQFIGCPQDADRDFAPVQGKKLFHYIPYNMGEHAAEARRMSQQR
jgi:hypothetical protein